MNTTMWNPAQETLAREELRALQLTRLKKTVTRVFQNVPFYREKMQRAGVTPTSIASLDDLRRLPFTYKTDLRDTYPNGLFAASMSDIVRIHASSGTTGKQTVVGYTMEDIDTWAEIMARSMGCAGVCKDSVVQISYGYGLFTGGLGAHYGAERIGATVLPTSSGNTKRQLTLLQDLNVTHLCCTPSYAMLLGEALREMGSPKLALKAGVFGAEPWTEGMRTKIEELLHIEALDVFGMSELFGPGVAMECHEKGGLHVWEDHFIAEIIDPITEEPVPIGEKGELAITTITKQGLPLIRYRTHDITHIIEEPCACGRTHARIAKLTGRTDDMIIVRGVNVFPSQVESVITGIPEVAPHYLLVVSRDEHLDALEIQVELMPGLFADEVRKIEALQARIRREIEATLGFGVAVRLMSPGAIERSEGKAKRVRDLRNLDA